MGFVPAAFTCAGIFLGLAFLTAKFARAKKLPRTFVTVAIVAFAFGGLALYGESQRGSVQRALTNKGYTVRSVDRLRNTAEVVGPKGCVVKVTVVPKKGRYAVMEKGVEITPKTLTC